LKEWVQYGLLNPFFLIETLIQVTELTDFSYTVAGFNQLTIQDASENFTKASGKHQDVSENFTKASVNHQDASENFTKASVKRRDASDNLTEAFVKHRDGSVNFAGACCKV